MTLDKLWTNIDKKNKDTIMKDTEEKEQNKMTNNNPQTRKTKKNANNNDNTNVNDQITNDTEENKAMNIRFKFKASSQQEAIKQHKKILSVFKAEMKTCKIITNQGHTADSLELKEVDYHEIGRNNKFL